MVIHILKDGRRVDDITGHIIRFEDFEPMYRAIANRKKVGTKSTPNTYLHDKNEVKS